MASWYCRTQGEVRALAFYLLTHTAVAPRSHATRWFRGCSYNKFSKADVARILKRGGVEIVERIGVRCPECNSSNITGAFAASQKALWKFERGDLPPPLYSFA